LKIDDDDDNASIGAIVVSVGGGGLLCGVLEGCARRKLRTKVITSETNGASCFVQAYDAGGGPITLPGIDSIATSLGATSCTPVALDRARSHDGGFAATACTDEEAIDACVRFARDHRMLVEPACGKFLPNHIRNCGILLVMFCAIYIFSLSLSSIHSINCCKR
jgi:L-serine/L-threonine ammonia-lyase